MRPCVYLLAQRLPSPRRVVYQGVAEDGNPSRRCAVHNRGECRATAVARPWEPPTVVVRGFELKGSHGALAFERDVKNLRVHLPGLRAKSEAVRRLLERPRWAGRGLQIMDLAQVRSSDQKPFGVPI